MKASDYYTVPPGWERFTDAPEMLRHIDMFMHRESGIQVNVSVHSDAGKKWIHATVCPVNELVPHLSSDELNHQITQRAMCILAEFFGGDRVFAQLPPHPAKPDVQHFQCVISGKDEPLTELFAIVSGKGNVIGTHAGPLIVPRAEHVAQLMTLANEFDKREGDWRIIRFIPAEDVTERFYHKPIFPKP